MNTYLFRLQETCSRIDQMTTKIDDTFHGGAWLFDRLIRFFDREKAAVSVVFPVVTRSGLRAYCEVWKNGTFEIRAVE